MHMTVCATLALCLYAAATDVKRLEIDNWVSLAVAVLFVLYGLTTPVSWGAHAAVMVAVLCIGLVLNRTGIMGGGDVKLLAALSLWAGFSGLPALLIGTSFAGAVVAIATLSMRKITLATPTGLAWIDGAARGETHVAYALAITAGAALMFSTMGG